MKSKGNELMRCNTKYPIVLVHGTGFRDRKHINYWGRIPKALEKEGARVFYSNHDAWGTIESNAGIIKNSVLDVLSKTGSEKVNLIAHSKGGLEARYMINTLGMDRYIASLTTISAPHHGSRIMDTFCRAPKSLYRFVSVFVDFYFKILGDSSPDFYNASRELSSESIKIFNNTHANLNHIYYQSYASKMKNSFSDILLFIPHLVIKKFEGENDGIVSVDSAKWGDFKGVITGNRRRGVSHADVVDLRRMNYSGFDIREIYVGAVECLKEKGL